MAAYLFTHFSSGSNGDKESIWFALSRDGLNWHDLGSEEPVLKTDKGTTGIRDPFMLYDEKKKKYFIIATDLCTTKGGSWYDFSNNGSRNLIIWESTDLINWSEERFVEVGISSAGCVWAPEAVFCKEENKWFVFWASNVKEDGESEPKQRIYASFTDDFINFTPAFKYIDAPTCIIDTNIVNDGTWYYRFSKDETNKFITLERCKSLIPSESEKFERVESDFLDCFKGVEGPECYRLENGKWCLIVDRYSTGKGYVPLLCDELSSGEFYEIDENSFNMGKRKKRHGSVIKISDEQAEKLISHYGISN